MGVGEVLHGLVVELQLECTSGEFLAHLYPEREPEPKHSQPSHRPAGPALRHDQRGKGRLTDCSSFPGVPETHEVRTRVCWQVISTARGMWSACRMARAFATTSACRTISAWLPSTTAQSSSTRTPSSPTLRVFRSSFLCKLRYDSLAVEGIVVTGKFRRAPDKSCSYFYGRQHPYQQRACQEAIRVHRVVAPHPGRVPKARRSGAHQ